MLARARACRLVLSISHRSLHAPRLPQPVPAWAGALAARAMAERLVAKTAPQDMAAASALQHVYTILNSRCEDARSLQDASLREGADGDTSAASGSQGDKEGGEAEGEADEVEGLVAELCLSLVEANGDELATVPLSAVAATLEEVLLELGVAQELPDGQLRLGSNNDARRARTMLLDMADEEEEGEDEEADEDDEAEEGAGTEGNGDGTRDDVGVEDDGDYDEVDEYDGEGGGEDAELEQADDEPEDMALLRSLLEPAPPTGTDEETAVAAKAEARAARVAAKESAGPGANLREVSFDLGRLEHESGRRRTDWQESVRHQRLSARIAEALRVMVYLDNISDDLVQGAVQLVDVDVAPSLRSAHVHWRTDRKGWDKRIQRALAASGPAMRSRLAKRLNMRFTPELRFVQSRAEEHMEEMNLLFDAIAEERRNYPEPEPVASQTAAPARRRVGRRRAAAQRHTDDTVDNE